MRTAIGGMDFVSGKRIASIPWGGRVESSAQQERRAAKERKKEAARNARLKTNAIPLRFPKLKRPSDAGNGATVMHYLNEDGSTLATSNHWSATVDSYEEVRARVFEEELHLIPGFDSWAFAAFENVPPEIRKLVADHAEAALGYFD